MTCRVALIPILGDLSGCQELANQTDSQLGIGALKAITGQAARQPPHRRQSSTRVGQWIEAMAIDMGHGAGWVYRFQRRDAPVTALKDHQSFEWAGLSILLAPETGAQRHIPTLAEAGRSQSAARGHSHGSVLQNEGAGVGPHPKCFRVNRRQFIAVTRKSCVQGRERRGGFSGPLTTEQRHGPLCVHEHRRMQEQQVWTLALQPQRQRLIDGIVQVRWPAADGSVGIIAFRHRPLTAGTEISSNA